MSDKDTIIRVHSKIEASGLGIWAYFNRNVNVYNSWRYKFKKIGLSCPKRRKSAIKATQNEISLPQTMVSAQR